MGEHLDGRNNLYDVEFCLKEAKRKRNEYIVQELKKLGFIVNNFSKKEKEELLDIIIEFYNENKKEEIKHLLFKLRNTTKNTEIVELKRCILKKCIEKTISEEKEIAKEEKVKIEEIKYENLKRNILGEFEPSNFEKLPFANNFYSLIFDYLDESKFYLEELLTYILKIKEKVYFESFCGSKENIKILHAIQLNTIVLDKIILYIEYSFSNIYFASIVPKEVRNVFYDMFSNMIINFKESLNNRLKENNDLNANCIFHFLSFLEFQDSKSIYNEEIKIWDKCNSEEITKNINKIIKKKFIFNYDKVKDLKFLEIKKELGLKKDNIYSEKMERLEKLIDICFSLDGGVIIPRNKNVYIVLYDLIFNKKLKIEETISLRLKNLIKAFENNEEISYISNDDKKYIEATLFKILYSVKDKEEEYECFFELKKKLLEIIDILLRLNNPIEIQNQLLEFIKLLIEFNKVIFIENRYYREKYQLYNI